MVEKKLIKVKDLEVLVYKKNIKNFHLNVLPPEGTVRVSVPISVSDETVRLFIIKKLPWIKKHIKNFQSQSRQTKRRYVSGESHYFKGQRYLLRIEESKRPKIEIKNKKYIYFYVPKHYTQEQRENYYQNWLRKELKKELETLIPKWEKIIGIKVNEVKIKKMKTRWGTCNPEAKRIWINLELIKKPIECLEYIIVHEMIHFFEKKHNKKFKAYMDKFLPKWEAYKRQLNEFILEDL
ncbi:MAG TPA: M48 family peptidase [Persephonella sp.]|uniref:Zinc metalloprotease n=1 Tax=Persephonella marina (strain DSM 14350 / EX-H1) TaxID=123214 RepID=C0QQY1_PERMH|nr:MULTISPECIES: SprT family zinc-dependent metalloprotease [Persephonella]ACO03280.1 zinc metalloprotease [Persephonella marina EX-H1]HCB68826.1 M48 family peptidase [Persephonella sp.]